MLNRDYDLEYVIVSHEADHWNFSENTDLSEALLIARKTGQSESNPESRVVCVNLWRNPRSAVEALALSRTLSGCTPPDVQNPQGSQGALPLMVGAAKSGEVVSVRWRKLKRSLWNFPCAFAQSELTRALYSVLEGKLYLPGTKSRVAVPLRALGRIGELGPDPRDVYDAFDLATTKTAYPALWGAKHITKMSQPPNAYLEPLSKPRPGRKLRKVTDLWPKASRVLITQRPWLKTKRVTAVRLDTDVLADVWWPLVINGPKSGVGDAEKAIVLWLNSTLGLLILLAHREETRGAWVQFKKPVLEDMPVLDVWKISRKARKELARTMDRLKDRELMPFPDMANDPQRKVIDESVAEALELPDFAVLRELLAREPIICLTMDRLNLESRMGKRAALAT